MRRRVLEILRIVLTLLLVAWVLSRISLGQAWGLLLRADVLPLAGALLLFLVSVFAGAWQWGRFLAAQGIDLKFRPVLELYWVGLFFNNFLPGNLGGDLVKVWDLRRQERDTLASATATLADRLTGLSALAFLALIAAIPLRNHPDLAGIATVVLIGAGFFILGAALFLLDPVATLIRRLAQSLRLLSGEGIRGRLLERLRLLRTRKRLLLGLFGFSLGVQILRVGVHWLVCLALVGSATPAFNEFFLAVPPLAFALTLPVTVGGLGLREGLAIPLFRPLGLVGEVPVTLQFAAYLLMLLVSLFGGLIFLARRRRATLPPA
ncbi:flippase-like domain-containing protein [bacterium]|nr:flippase-like domain-containing protein [bacterium]